MNLSYRALSPGLLAGALLFTLVCGCQQKASSPPPQTEGKSAAELDTEYRALLAETGLYSGGAVTPPAQVEAARYGELLLVAAGHGSPELLTRLLATRPDINLNERYDGRTLLHASAASLHAANSNLLLEKGLDPNAQDNLGRTPLHLVVAQMQGELLARLLLSRGAAVDLRDEQGMTPLLSALPPSLKLLADKGADLSAQDRQGNSAFHWAVYRKSYEQAERLTELGAPPDLQNSAGKTPLHHALAPPDPKMVQLLLKAGAKTDIPDINGLTAAQAAESTGNRAVMDLFKQP